MPVCSIHRALTFRPWRCFLHCVCKQHGIFWRRSLCTTDNPCFWQFIWFTLWSHGKDLNDTEFSLLDVPCPSVIRKPWWLCSYCKKFFLMIWALSSWRKALGWTLLDFSQHLTNIRFGGRLSWMCLEGKVHSEPAFLLFPSDFHHIALGSAPS